MANDYKTRTTMYFPNELLARLDKYLAERNQHRLQEGIPRLSRTNAVIYFVERGLEGAHEDVLEERE